MLGVGDTVARLAEYDDRDGRPHLAAQYLTDTRIAVHERGECIGIEDHARSSGSITSKASSILAWMRAVSARRRRNFPNPCIHSGSRG
jgi:hypothetical protein